MLATGEYFQTVRAVISHTVVELLLKAVVLVPVDGDELVASIGQILAVTSQPVGIRGFAGDNLIVGEVVDVRVDMETKITRNDDALLILGEGDIVDIVGRTVGKGLELNSIMLEDEGLILGTSSEE